jgi:tripartite-type tricarboxylate transporter receptor subunit TctC
MSVLLFFALLLPQAARSQDYPNRSLRLIVPFPPGGATDITARIFANEMAVALKQPVVVENRPGASGAIGIGQVAKSNADGYTLGVSGVGPTVILPIVDPRLSYQPMRDLEIVAGLSIVELILVARPSFGPDSLSELVSFAAANPGKVTYSSAGITGPQQLQMEQLAMLTGTKLFHVPFSGDGPSLTALLTGTVDISLLGLATGLGLIKEGKLKPLAVTGKTRLDELPNVPTVFEQTGVSEFTGYTWNIMVAPKGTPQPIVALLNRSISEIAAKKEIQDKLSSLGLRLMPGTPSETTGFVLQEIARHQRVIDQTGMRRD